MILVFLSCYYSHIILSYFKDTRLFINHWNLNVHHVNFNNISNIFLNDSKHKDEDISEVNVLREPG